MALSPLLPVPAVLAAIIVGTDRRLVRDLRHAGAMTPDRAIAVGGHWLRQARLRRLVGVGAVIETAGGRHYLDETGWRDYRRRRRARVLTVLALALLMAAAAMRWPWSG